MAQYSYQQTTQNIFCQVRTVDDLARLLKTQVFALEFFAKNPSYNEFKIPKKNGGFRLLEDPEENLKAIQRELNYYLQCCYYLRRTSAAYAFQLADDDDDETEIRNILTNAQCHLNRDWMLNADFLDFFHQVSQQEVFEVFLSPPFNFQEDLAMLLMNLTTYKGRLPMGAPTSPVLSNFATIGLDYDLLDYSKRHQWVYTRYADDLNFSSYNAITHEHLIEIKGICKLYNFVFNENKVKIYSPGMPKTVTGLKVSDKICLPDDYLPNLTQEIQKLAHVFEVNFRTGREESTWVRKFEQQIEGHLEFMRFILGENHQEYQDMARYYEKAQNPAANYDPISWLEIGYINWKPKRK